MEPELAELVDLKFFCGFTFSEIAALRNLSERTVIRKLGKASISIAALAPICRSEELMSKLSPDQWQALSPRLDEPLELGDDERSAWFATLRAEDPTLARQLEMLLQEHRELSEEGFLGERPVALTGAPGLAGQIFSVYTLVSQIGHGGMGTVWLAQRNDGRFERRVAAKVLNFALMGKGGEERFKREGRILGRLKYPHIAELIDADVSPSGQPFLVLEPIEGGHIDLYCDSTQARRPSARPAVPRCLGGRGACTCQPDRPPLKPSNILVRTDGQVKLLDFGIAKLLKGGGQSGAPPLTLGGFCSMIAAPALTVTPVGGFAGNVSLSCAPVTRITCSISPATLTPGEHQVDGYHFRRRFAFGNADARQDRPLGTSVRLGVVQPGSVD